MEHIVCGHPVHKIRIDEALAKRARDSFAKIWNARPAKPGMYTFANGRTVRMPRYQQAYDRLYSFGSDGGVLPLPELFRPYAVWLANNVCERYNGAMVTWYDSFLGHYIGPHKDDTRQLVPGDPICSLSFGDSAYALSSPRRS